MGFNPNALPSVVKPLTVEEVKNMVKDGSIILGAFGGRAPDYYVETGNVIRVEKREGYVSIVWLDGHSSRNDDVKFEDILSIWDKSGPRMELDVFSGTGYLTEAGVQWKQEHEKPNEE